MSFASLDLIDGLLRTLESIGYNTPTPIQKQAIPAILAGRDLLGAAQTGTGKTAAFALPLLQRLTMEGGPAAPNHVRCLVLVPTRELADQVYQSFHSYGFHLPLRSAVAYGGVPMDPQLAKLRKGLDVLVATPGRLLDLHRKGAIEFGQLTALVLDEADRMLDLGFAADLDLLFAVLPAERQTLLFSATMPDPIRAMARQLLRDPLTVQASAPNTAARTVRQMVFTTDKRNKPELFVHLLRKEGWGQVLVFVKTRKGVEQLTALLQGEGISADSIHGDKPQLARIKALKRFKANDVQILVATDVAARGLDIEALPLVVNFDLPTVAEDYVHRIGRTGRAGAEGEAISLICADEVELLRAIEKLTGAVLPRLEEAGFEADHRVPSTGAPSAPAARAPAAKPARGAAKPAKGAAAGTAARPAVKQPAPARDETPRPAGGFGGLKEELPPKEKQRSRGPIYGARAGSPGAGASGGRSGTGASGGQGGKVVVTATRGAKSTARAAGRAASKPGGRGNKR
ncbi:MULTISPECIES: DEAD/DEAH box helicase [unclassified Duganella]|uniref:DEAD/DEAH box helicase n=1 Tax=unclassified Duganella TaxID=2636909 RepID=UPI0006F41217|nr:MULTISPECIES: DEAD/DEAH box helicase [unclassified Duganella]KQV59336.1 DEAD/DEAH box helicase [Duganella sp. Root336D2]KRC01432.1 DEAD/DEAH box helicase [Duganella sp. Root198D2]